MIYGGYTCAVVPKLSAHLKNSLSMQVSILVAQLLSEGDLSIHGTSDETFGCLSNISIFISDFSLHLSIMQQSIKSDDAMSIARPDKEVLDVLLFKSSFVYRNMLMYAAQYSGRQVLH